MAMSYSKSTIIDDVDLTKKSRNQESSTVSRPEHKNVVRAENIAFNGEAANNGNNSNKNNKLWIFICLAVAGFITFCLLGSYLSVYAGTRKTHEKCIMSDEKTCSEGDAICLLEKGKPHCQCVDRDKEFYSSTCRYPCEHDAKAKCPVGVCYRTECFPDVISFVRYFYRERCHNTTNGEKCNTTCNEIIIHTCANMGIQPFCNKNESSVPKDFTDFACQVNEPSGKFKPLSDDEAEKCQSDPECRPLKLFYPCLAHYVRNGSAVCSKKCVVPKEQGRALSFYGYCVLQKPNCNESLANLMTTLEGNNIGYSMSKEALDNSSTVAENISKFPNLKKLLYPLMLIYGVLVKKGLVLPVHEVEADKVEYFLTNITNKEKSKILELLYADDKDLIQKLKRQASKLDKETIISDVLLLRVAHLVMLHNCTSLSYCPPLENAESALMDWAFESSRYCSISRALYSSASPVNASLYEPILWTRDFTPMNVSILHTPSFVEGLIEKTRVVINTKKLNENMFTHSFSVCNETENSSGINGSRITLPLTIYTKLKNSIQQGQLSSFALILANAQSIKKAICNEQQTLPSNECEFRLYLAFLAFMPPPNEPEMDLIDDNDTASIYFTLRGVMRLQLKYGTRMSPFTETIKETTNTSQIRESARRVVDNCLQKIVI